MKFLLLILIVPWVLLPIFYNRLRSFKNTNLAVRAELDAREARLKKVAKKIADIDKMSAQIEEYKNALASAQIEHTKYKEEATARIQELEKQLTQRI